MSEHWPARLCLPSLPVVQQAADYLRLVLDHLICFSKKQISKQKVAGVLLPGESALHCHQVCVFLLSTQR